MDSATATTSGTGPCVEAWGMESKDRRRHIGAFRAVMTYGVTSHRPAFLIDAEKGTGAQALEQPRPQPQLPQQQPAAVRPQFPTIKATDHPLPAQASKLQSFRATLCSHRVLAQFLGKLFITNQLYNETEPYTRLW